jgi:branched-chain amino acid transport system permease protein
VNLELIPDALAGALTLGAMYTVIAMGWIIIFRATHIMNFATGEYIVLGSLVLYVLLDSASLPLPLALPLALLFMGIVGLATHYTIMRPLAAQPVFAGVIVTFGLTTVFAAVIVMIWGSQRRSLPISIDNAVYGLPGGGIITRYGIAAIVVTACAYGAVLTFLRRSRLGAQMRAAAENPGLASQLGIDINKIFGLSWALALMVATIGGVAFAASNSLSIELASLGLLGLAPALVGGMDSVKGAIAGGYVVAVVQNLAVVWLGGGVSEAAAFAVLLVVLAIRPYGLFGTPEVRRV